MNLSKDQKEISRRQFLKFIPPAILAGLAARYATKHLTTPEDTPSLHAESRKLTESQEPASLLIDPEMDLFLEEYIKTHGPVFSNATEIAKVKELDESAELSRLTAIQKFKEGISVPYDQINPEIFTLHQRGFILDFASLPEVVEARNNPNLEESVKKIISLLSVESREMIKRTSLDLIFNNQPEVIALQKKLDAIYDIRYKHLDYSWEDFNIVNYKNYGELWNRLFPGKALPSAEMLDQLSSIYQTKMNLLYDKFFKENYSSDGAQTIKNWENQASCNLYASTFFACLVGQEYLSHRVDSENNPVIYVLNKQTGRTEFFIKGKDGQLVKPIGQVRELSAGGQHEWLKENGEEHGWVDVTNFDYAKKVAMLKEGYVFYGSTESHNWVITGLTVNGEFQPFLTQATYNNLLGAFKRADDIGIEFYTRTDASVFYSRNDSFYGAGYKLMPQLFDVEDATLFAIKPRK